jgi:excisionase family DNA binding protein
MTGAKIKLLTVEEAASRLGLQPATLRFWIWTRKIEYVKIGRAVRVNEDTVGALIDEGTVPAQRRGGVCGVR